MDKNGAKKLKKGLVTRWREMLHEEKSNYLVKWTKCLMRQEKLPW